MMKKLSYLVLVGFFLCPTKGEAFEIFGKGNVSKRHESAADEWTLSTSAAAGIAFAIFPRLRVEGRYTLISSQQSKLETIINDAVFTLSDIRTKTSIYSVSMEFQVTNDKAAFQPYIAIGVGWLETAKSFYAYRTGMEEAQFVPADSRSGISANLGVGFRMRMARSIALEVEAVSYGIDPHKEGALIDWDAKIGLRLFL